MKGLLAVDASATEACSTELAMNACEPLLRARMLLYKRRLHDDFCTTPNGGMSNHVIIPAAATICPKQSIFAVAVVWAMVHVLIGRFEHLYSTVGVDEVVFFIQSVGIVLALIRPWPLYLFPLPSAPPPARLLLSGFIDPSLQLCSELQPLYDFRETSPRLHMNMIFSDESYQ